MATCHCVESWNNLRLIDYSRTLLDIKEGRRMFSHYCLDPNDLDFTEMLYVTFEGTYPDIKLLSATDIHKHNVLSDLYIEQRRDLKREISVYYRFDLKYNPPPP